MNRTKQVVEAAQHRISKRCQFLRGSPVVVHLVSHTPAVAWSHT